MIQSLSLEGFKSFYDRATLKFSPISLITGTNSSGKSTVFHALLLLKQALEQPTSGVAGLPLNGPWVVLGEFEDVRAHRKLDGEEETISPLCQVELVLGPLPTAVRASLRRVSRGTSLARASVLC